MFRWPMLATGTALAAASFACSKEKVGTWDDDPVPSASAAARVPVDRLGPGELAPGNDVVFGLPIPRRMRLDQRFEDVAYVSGKVRREQLSNYVRKRVSVAHVEVGAARTVFPAARINGDTTRRTYRIEIMRDGIGARMVIKDLSKPQAVKGLTQPERWKRAGMTPQGELIDELEQE